MKKFPMGEKLIIAIKGKVLRFNDEIVANSKLFIITNFLRSFVVIFSLIDMIS